MANPDDLEKLCQGPKFWNAWREENPDIIPDLRDASLSLSQRQLGPSNGGPIDLADVDLEGAELRHTTLTGADLERANLTAADLVYARLDGANLIGADLTDAILDYADLTGAKLDRAILTGASLANVRGLTQAQIAAAHGDATTLLPAAVIPPDSWFPPLDDDLIGEYPTPEPYHQTSLYEVLGVMPAATPEDIRSAFRNLVKRLHPDLNPGDDEAQEAFKRVSAAYRILSDANKRGRYDRGEIGNDGEVSPEFEAKQQFRRYARRFYAAAAGSLLLAVGVLGAVWYAVLVHQGNERGRIEIAVATPPKYAERLDQSASADLPAQQNGRPKSRPSAKTDSGPDALTSEHGNRVVEGAGGDALPGRPATGEETKPNIPADISAVDKPAAEKHASRPDVADEPSGEKPSAAAEEELARASAARSSNRGGQNDEAPASAAEARANGGASPTAKAERQPSAPAEKAGAKTDGTQLANLEQGSGAAADPAGDDRGQAVEQKRRDGAQTGQSSTSPPGPAQKEAHGIPTQPADARDADRPLGKAHSEAAARPAQADAARSSALVQERHPTIVGVGPPAQTPPGGLVFLRHIHRWGVGRDAISDLFGQMAIEQALADRKTQATTASVGTALPPERLGDQEEIRDLYTHSIPGAGEGENRPWPESLRAEKKVRPRALPASPPSIPIARDLAEKGPDRNSGPPPAALRKQAVSDILAGGL